MLLPTRDSPLTSRPPRVTCYACCDPQSGRSKACAAPPRSLTNTGFCSRTQPDETFLNLVMDFVPQTVYSMSRSYSKAKKTFPLLFLKLYMYQLCRSLAYIHSLGVCHRDIKPQNLLVHPELHILKLCDFGSAKILVKGAI